MVGDRRAKRSAAGVPGFRRRHNRPRRRRTQSVLARPMHAQHGGKTQVADRDAEDSAEQAVNHLGNRGCAVMG